MAVTVDGNDWYTRASLFAAADPATLMGWAFTTDSADDYKSFLFQQSNLGIAVHDGTSNIALISTPTQDIKGSTVLSTSVWYHLAWTRSSDSHSLYVNGVLEAGPTADVAGATNFIMGDYGASDDGDEWLGRIAAVKVWSAALTASEIQNEMRQYAPKRFTNLLAFYPLLSTADDETDYYTGGLTLTVTGTPVIAEGPPIPWRRYPPRMAFTTTAAAATFGVLVGGNLADRPALIGGGLVN